MSRVIGIDLGTTNSVVATLEQGEAVVIPNREGSRTTPSMVGFSESGERFVGHQAKRQAVLNPERTVYGAKRLVGRRFDDPAVQDMASRLTYQLISSDNGDAWISVEGQSMSPQEISAHVLAKLKSTAEDYYGEEVTQAVITVPAYFNDAQRQATKEAGKLAGLEVLRIINEPTAAALAYGVKQQREGIVGVFDLGGGTFDLTILRLRQGVYEVMSTCGDNTLGGDDFDHVILQHLIDQFYEETGLDVSADKMAVQRLREAAENAKCELSTISETNINLPFLAVDDSGPRHFNLALSRSQLNDLVYDLVRRLETPCAKALEDAGLTNSELNEVLLVGGMTRMPIVRELVNYLFEVSLQRSVNPDEVVAMGAAVQSGILVGEVKEVVLLDVTPISLGIRAQGNRFSRLIKRNTPIPVRETKMFTSTEDNQELVTITVLQGEDEHASENKTLGTFILTNIPVAPAGVPRIEVAFDIDTDGILHVSAKELNTGQKQEIQINDAHGLSLEEFTIAHERIGALH